MEILLVKVRQLHLKEYRLLRKELDGVHMNQFQVQYRADAHTCWYPCRG